MGTLNSKLHLFKNDTKGELQNAYSPLLNLVDSNANIGDFTTSELNFNRYTPVDIVVSDEYDGSNLIIINDGMNYPKLINSRFSVQENNTFNIPLHNSNSVTNVYEEKTFNKDSQLLKLYDKIPDLEFLGIKEGGGFKCGSYVFYFKLADIDGNMTNIVQESSIVQVHMGPVNSKKVRMGMQDENAEKCIKFKLTNIDLGFDYVRIFYERKSTNDSQALIDTYFMINLNFPIRNGKCEILLTGNENTLQIAKSDIQNEFADIQTAKTLAIVDNVLFLGNVSSYELNYSELQQFAWRIIPSIEIMSESLGEVNSSDYSFSRGKAYYDVKNVYDNTGYWGDEFYRFGIVYIYDNNILSPVFNIQGCDMSYYINSSGGFRKGTYNDYIKYFFKSDNQPRPLYYYREQESEDFIFNEKGMHNSKGVIRIPKIKNFQQSSNTTIEPQSIRIVFDLSRGNAKCVKPDGSISKSICKDLTVEEFLKKNHIKGFFFVRQKRIPTVIAQGMVVGLTGRYFGSIPVLKNKSDQYITKSFLNNGRMLLPKGSTVIIDESDELKVELKALLVPDYDINEAVLNLIFTGLEFYLERQLKSGFKIIGDHHCIQSIEIPEEDHAVSNVKLTAVPKGTSSVTDGENYFSSIAGSPQEAHKTSDVNHRWSRTVPQELTASTSLIRGNWGSYVGMSTNKFDYGDIVNIKLNSFSDDSQIALEFQKRFSDFSFYSAISPRYNITLLGSLGEMVSVSRGDCFPSLFTHRMMSNFIDPELPTNHQIIDPGCWAKNYGVRCTAQILQTTHSNLTGDSDGWYIPSPASKKSAIVSIIFGILTGNIGTVINAISDLSSSGSTGGTLDKYANEIALAFEVYIGDVDKLGKANSSSTTDDDLTTQNTTYEEIIRNGHIKKVEPKRQDSQGGLNLKAIFKSDTKWELHGIASINRADVNAVSFGSWITFPVCSGYNLAFRDIDFSNATEEASLQKKRSFYPLEEMDVTNHLLESNKINGATKCSLASNSFPAYTTVPYIKQEYFNRIYWSKPNIALNFINSYRIIFKDQYKEYNKEFGSITKILPIGNNLLVVFQHGIGILPINKTPLTELEYSSYLSSRSVLPSLVEILTKDFGSMWKDSILLTPQGITYGVDTVARKIWRVAPGGQGMEFISDFKVLKFLNDWIDLSEYDFNEYQGHINVKTHYNVFKHDVIFTYYKDIPMSRYEYVQNPKTKKWDKFPIGSYWYKRDDKLVLKRTNVEDVDYKEVNLSGNLVLEGTPDPKTLIEKWVQGKTWSLCYNEITKNFVTFYDWYPVESCNIDNIFFSFDKELIDEIYQNEHESNIVVPKNKLNKEVECYRLNKHFVDKSFTNNCNVYVIRSTEFENKIDNIPSSQYISFYYKPEAVDETLSFTNEYSFSNDWKFVIMPNTGKIEWSNLKYDRFYITEIRYFDEILDASEKGILQFYQLRDSEYSRMFLWKHGLAGLYTNQGRIKPTNWYGKQHEFNFEFVVNEQPTIQKIFNNLKIISNKTAPNKFEYEIVGEGYDWFDLKPVVQWINDKYKEDADSSHGTTEKEKFEYWYKQVLLLDYNTLRSTYLDFPEIFTYELENRKINKLPFLHIETADRKGLTDKNKTYLKDQYWDKLVKTASKDYKYSFNTSETIIVEDEQLNELRVHTESLGNDIKKYGRIRGNMLYLEDLWDIEVRPISFNYVYLKNGELAFTKSKEARHRDKYIKIKVRYTGQDLAVIQGIITQFDVSYA